MNETLIATQFKLTDPQVEAFKTIYDYIGRFAGVQQAGWNQNITLYNLQQVKIQDRHGHLQPIPPKTFQILESIGTDKLSKYFSPMSYPKHFEGFCKKLIKQGSVHFSDYVADGLIVFDLKQESSVEVTEITYEDDGLFGMREVA